MTTSSTRSSLRPHARAHARAESGKAHDDAVAGEDLLAAARDDHRVAADDRGDLGVGGHLGAPQVAADERVMRRVGENVELDDLDLAVGEQVGLARGRKPERRRDGVRGLEFRGDHEVDAQVALAPGVEVGLTGIPHDRLRARYRFARESEQRVSRSGPAAGGHCLTPARWRRTT